MSLIKSNFPNWPKLMDYFDDDWKNSGFMKDAWAPAINVIDNEDNFEIEIAAPGLKKEDFDVAIANGMLTIKGMTEKENEEKNKNYTRKEFSMKSFSKSFTLPENVKEEEIEAKYEDGVLRLFLSKSKVEIVSKKEVKVN